MASCKWEGNFESQNDCFNSDSENVDPDQEFQDFLEKTKENLLSCSQKRRSRMSNGKEDPLKQASTSKQQNTNESLDSFKNFSSDLQNCLPSVKKGEMIFEKSPASGDVSRENLPSSDSVSTTDSSSDEDYEEVPVFYPDRASNRSLAQSDSDSSDDGLNSSRMSDHDMSEFYQFIREMRERLNEKEKKAAAAAAQEKSKSQNLFSRLFSPNSANKDAESSQGSTRIKELISIHGEDPRLSFMKKRRTYAVELYHYFNKTVFNNRLPEDMAIRWSGRLKSTAGRVICRRKKSPDNSFVYSCYIELSHEVMNTYDRLQDTLIHEMCHAACWLINNVNARHGPLWQTWARRCHLILPHIEVPTICHNYELSYAYTLKCKSCDFVRRRHVLCPKLKRKTCPKCNSPTTLTKTKATF